jgi:hypothetical protein
MMTESGRIGVAMALEVVGTVSPRDVGDDVGPAEMVGEFGNRTG